MTPVRVVVSGIDGALLDPMTRDYDPARPAIAALARLGVPLVLCSGRTRAEVAFVSRIFGLGAPMIAENGAILLVPEGHLRHGVPGSERDGEWHVLRLGPPRERLRDSIDQIAAAAGVRVRFVSEMACVERARRAAPVSLLGPMPAVRGHTEPFLLDGQEESTALAREAEARGLTLSRAQGFWHLCGGADKGLAVRTLLSLYEREGCAVEAIALGTWQVDLPMLRAVQRPIVLPGPGGQIEPVLAAELPGAERAWQGGPRGWNDAVLSALAQRRLPALADPKQRPPVRPLIVTRAAS